MRRSVIALAVAVAVLIVAVGAAVAVIATRQGGQTSADRSPGMMWSSPRPGSPGTQPRQRGPGTWMHGVTVNSEFQYLAEMVPHHQEAVTAAKQLERSDRPELRAFGRSIVTTQTAQIDRMNTWLATWYPGRSTRVGYQPMMRDLSGLSGDRLDRVFLQDMIWHHMAAVMMSQQLLAHGLAPHPQVNALAVSIRDHQHAEILQMARWLNRWYDATWMRPGPGWRHWNRWMDDWMHDRGWSDGRRDEGDRHMGPEMMW